MILLMTNVILNTIDVLMLFLLSHAFIKRIPIFTVKRVLIGIGYGVSMGTVGYFVDQYIYRFIVTVMALVVVYFIVKLPFTSVLLLYALTWVIFILQFVFVLILQFFSLSVIPSFLIIQILSLFSIIAICKFMPLNKWFRYIEEHVELKLMIFLLAFAGFSIVFYMNFQYSWPYLLYFGGVLITVLIAICKIGLKIVYQRHKIPFEAYGAYHTALGLMVNAYADENHEEILRLNDRFQDEKFKLETEGFQFGKVTENIIRFIENKQKVQKKKVDIQYSIEYDEHPTVSTVVVIKMLSILLDNAIENGEDKPVIVEMLVMKSYINLTVKNAFSSTDSDELNRIFTVDGYTTKKRKHRGYGLANLYQDLQEIGGKIVTACDYNVVEKTQYLSVTINL